MITLDHATTLQIQERGESFLSLTSAQAAALQSLEFCRVTPTSTPGLWRVTNVTRVGVVGLGQVRINVRPKTPLRSLIFMSSYAGRQATVWEDDHTFDADDELPVALASALIQATDRATRGGLLKGYVPTDEAGMVLRGRWDIARQLRTRPGVPLPVELTYDDYTEDVVENRIVKAAIHMVRRHERMPPRIVDQLNRALAVFGDVSDLGVHREVPAVASTRLNAHYQPALRIARWILESTSWAHQHGDGTASAFLLNVASVFEQFVGEVLREALADSGIHVELQATDWTLDAEGAVRLRPDIVVSRDGEVVAVADTKYKVWDGHDGSPPNADVYQALAYALTAGVGRAHLLYVSGDVRPKTYTIRATGTEVIAHAIDLSGKPDVLLGTVRAMATSLAWPPFSSGDASAIT